MRFLYSYMQLENSADHCKRVTIANIFRLGSSILVFYIINPYSISTGNRIQKFSYDQSKKKNNNLCIAVDIL